MRCTVTGEPYTVFGYGGKQVRDNIHAADLVARLRGLPRRAARRRPSTTSAAAARSTARCSRRSRCASDRGPRARLDAVRRGPHRRPPLVDLRPRRASSATTPTGSSTLRHRGHPARDPRRQRRALDGRRLSPTDDQELLAEQPPRERRLQVQAGQRRRSPAAGRGTSRAGSAARRLRSRSPPRRGAPPRRRG